jgi:hypothetical protein
MRVFIDGTPVGSSAELDQLGYSPTSFGAVEVYDLASIVPIEYQRADGCAVALFWTKLKVSR